ncbi:MAG: OmpA family protein [Aureispira sp.]|nr:OmpA family protein [Aureispira sp.]
MRLSFFRVSIVFVLLSFVISPNFAQKEYTDHKPSYRPWQDDYILDKIEYTSDRTIFYFRFVCRSGMYTSAIFYPPGGEHPWYIKGRNVKKNFELKAIKNVRRNGELIASSVRRKSLKVAALAGSGYTVFSCEVHFERLPNDLEYADFIEGRGQEYNRNHFNCFNVKLKTWNSKELGSKKDSEEEVKKFEKKFGIERKHDDKAEKERKEKERKERERKEKERKEREEKERLEKEKADKEKAEKERIEKERLEKEEKERLEKERLEKEKADKEKAEKERLEKERIEKERLEKEKDLLPYLKVSSLKDIRCGKRLVLDGLKFHDNSTKFKGMVYAKRSMYILYLYLHENPTATVKLFGHTDVFGSPEKNMDLSKQRVYKVFRWLSGMGISSKRIDYEWFGPSQPIVKEGDAINRRVELIISCD